MPFYLTRDPVPSADMRNVFDNAQNLDFALNDITSSFWTDRLGRNRMSWFGLESAFTVKLTDFESRFATQLTTQETAFDAAQADKEARFVHFLDSSGYVFLGDYEDGPFQFSARNQYIRFQGQFFRLSKETDTGFTTTGTDETTFTNDVTHLVLIDGDTLRQNLGSGDGDPIVAPEKVRLATVDDDSDFPLDATLAELIFEVNPRMWKSLVKKGATPDLDDWSDAIQAALNYANKKKKKFVNTESYGIGKTIELPFPVTIEFLKYWGKWYALPGFAGHMVKSKNAPEGDYMTLRDPVNECYCITIRGMTLDGGWLSDESTPDYIAQENGLQLFGVQHSLDDIIIMNVRGKPYNIGGRDFTTVPGMAPSDYLRLRADHCGEEAFIFGGSSDSHALMVKVRDAGQKADSAYNAIRVGPNGTLRAGFFHVWNTSQAKRHANCLDVTAWDSIFVNMHFEGAANSQIQVSGGRNQFIGFEVYNQWKSGGAMIKNLNSSNSFKGRAYINQTILPNVSVYAMQLGDAENAASFTNVDMEIYNTKPGAVNAVNHTGYLSGKFAGDTTNYTSEQDRALVVSGSLVEGKDSVIFSTPQYRSFIGGGSVNLAKGMNATGDVNSQGLIYGQNAVLRNVTIALPSTSGTLYKVSNGTVMIKE
ncbi:hypothetical protein [Klebsiella spallanzanii]|uniref:Tail spike TSP1/Gp66 N-terminal domain-containing protein n=1 Tax=Klebsiella spallanzanii TaxID=2587528 RepID=A0A564J7F2_9ENTR|nr:hypothetical protein [Klebsiella spallanzanii]VUS53630.1 hypothetical protein SB6408_04525 [Klebsiella spallanzanii]